MRHLAKYFGMGLLIAGLVACDQKTNDTASDNPAAHTPTQTVTLMGGKFNFSLPANMTDKSGKLNTRSNNMHVYADDSGQRTVIVIEGNTTRDGLDVLARRLEQQQRSRDPKLQVMGNRSITLKGQPAQQLDTIISARQQTSWSSVLLTKVDGKLVTMQVTMPADNKNQAHTDAENIINTITLQ